MGFKNKDRGGKGGRGGGGEDLRRQLEQAFVFEELNMAEILFRVNIFLIRRRGGKRHLGKWFKKIKTKGTGAPRLLIRTVADGENRDETFGGPHT